MDMRFAYSPAEVAKVRTVQFGILSPDDIRQMSVLQIEHGETTERGKPKVGGLSDPRLGTIDRRSKCETCMANMAECPGHFGHLELAKPMFHIGFMKIVLSIMRCVCFNCSKILADQLWMFLRLFGILIVAILACFTYYEQALDLRKWLL